MLNDQSILEALKAVKYPGYSRDIVSFGIVKHVAANNGAAAKIKAGAEAALRGLAGVQMVSVQVNQPAAPVGAQAPGGMVQPNKFPASNASSPSRAARAAWANRLAP